MLAKMRFLRAKKPEETKRSGTPTKSGQRSILGGVLFLFVVGNGFLLGSSALSNLSAVSRNLTIASGEIPVSRYTMSRLALTQNALGQANRIKNPDKRERYKAAWNNFLDRVLRFEVRWSPLTDKEEGRSLREMRRVFLHKGAAGFTVEHLGGWMASKATWPSRKGAGNSFFRSLSLVTLLWLPLLIGLPLGMNNKDLARTEWSFEWLYTFPVSTRSLFAGKLFAYAFLNAIGWCFLFPFMIAVFMAGGYGVPAAIALGAAGSAYMELLAAAIVLVLEVALRKFLPLRQIKNAQAFFTIAGAVSLVLFYSATFPSPLESFLVHHAASLPYAFRWNPFVLPLMLALPSASALQIVLAVFAMIITASVVTATSLLGSERMSSGGLTTTGGPYQGERKARLGLFRGTWLRGVAAQEMYLLARDRNLQVQVLLLPLLLPAFYLLTDYGMLHAVTGNPRHAAALVFAVGAYTFLIGAMQLLARERKTLWYLLSMPQSLTSILAKKTAVWAIIGLLYGGAVLAFSVHFGGNLPISAWSVTFFALYGIILYAFIASGIGILATNVEESEPQAALGVGPVYLYMILAAMYAVVFYTPSAWTRFGQVVICTLLAFALWQKVSDNCPYLLDPTDIPPRVISLSDGMIAAFAFFVLQGAAALALHYFSTLAPMAQITSAYILAGFVVGCVTLCVLWMKGVPDLWRQIGVKAKVCGEQATPLRRSLMLGTGMGVVAAAGAFVYIHVLGLFPAWRLWRQDAVSMSLLTSKGRPIWLCVLAVLAAPLFEEFIFRGLIFQGLKRSTGSAVATLGSAALFALIHPPIAVIPVFGLGIVAAISFDQSGLIWAPIAAHAVYNGCVLFLGKI
jgi:membrane protease YdiL (CAAX protease family)